MIIRFLKKTGLNYAGQLFSAFVFAYFVFGYTSNIGFAHPFTTLHHFIFNGASFFYKFISESVYYYLFIIPFTVIPFLLLWILFKKYFFKYRIQQIQKHVSIHIVHDLIESLFSGLGFVLLNMLLVKFADQGIIKLYDNFSSHPWYSLPIAITAWLLFEDTWFYWVHRIMHHKFLYKWIHASHHVSVDTSPFTQNAFHFVESLLAGLGSIFATMLFPSWAPAYFAFQLFGAISNMVAHSGYEFYPKWMLFWKTTATHHNMHHHYFDGNYGTHLTFWDKIMGTEFKDYEQRFLEIKNRVSQKK